MAASSAISPRTASGGIDGGSCSTIVAPAGSAGQTGGGAATNNTSAKTKLEARIATYVVAPRAAGQTRRAAGGFGAEPFLLGAVIGYRPDRVCGRLSVHRQPVLGGPRQINGREVGVIPLLPELAFAQIPSSSQSRYAGDRFSYMASGPSAAPPLLLLHGIGANSMYWRFQFAPFAERFRVIAWNAPGYLLSDELLADMPDWRDWAGALDDFLTALGVGRFDVWGNSFGTRVAQCFAATYPGRIGRAVFTGTSIAQGTSAEERARAAEGRARLIAGGGFGFGERATALLGSGASADILAIVQHVLRATQPKGFLQAVRFVASGSAPPVLGEGLSLPLLMIQGAEDRVTPAAANAALLAQALPRARIETIAGCGHLPEVEDYERVNKLAMRFLS